MEKRDLIIIIVAVFIVLFMAMYVKPLVTGKPVQLIPDELSNLLKGGNQTQAINNSSISNTTRNATKRLPAVTSISPDNLTADGNITDVAIEGRNFTESMNNVTFFKDGENRTFSTSLINGSLIAGNVSLPEGKWVVKIVDNDTEVTYNTTRVVNAKAVVTPVPTWNGTPLPLQTTEKKAETFFQSRPYPQDTTPNKTSMKTFSNFGGVRSVSTDPITIPYGYWDLIYNVNFRTEIANPKDTSNNVFEFNKQYKEPLTTYEGDPVIYYEKNSSVPSQYSIKSAVVSDTVFISSTDKALIKKPDDTRDASPPYTESTESAPPSLVETVGYLKPNIKISVKNKDDPNSPPIIIQPNGGIDPLQWDEAKHKTEAEKILKQQGKEDIFSSSEYTDAWKKTWEQIKDPRPWTERIYGKGNYSFEIDTQSIDSYNIQIKVPESQNNSPIINTDDTYITEQNSIKKVLAEFFNDYNQEINTDYFTNITNYFISDLTNPDIINPIYQQYVQTRASGLSVTDVIVDDIFIRGDIGKNNSLIRGNTAEARGSLKTTTNGSVKLIPFDIGFTNEPSGWKLQTVPIIRT